MGRVKDILRTPYNAVVTRKNSRHAGVWDVGWGMWAVSCEVSPSQGTFLPSWSLQPTSQVTN